LARYKVTLWLCCLVVILSLMEKAVQPVAGRYFSKTFTSNYRMEYLTHFGFDRGGEFNITLDMQAPSNNTYPLLLLGCTSSDFDKTLNYFNGNTTKMCMNLSEINCMSLAYFDQNPNYHFEQLNSEKFLYFYLLNCGGEHLTLGVNAIFLNPGGQQLSLEFSPMLTVYVILLVIWVILIPVWWLLRDKQVPFHKYVTIFPITKVLWAIIAIVYWKHNSTSIDQNVGLTWLYYSIYIISQLVFVSILYLVSIGWKRFTNTLTTWDKIVIWGLLGTLVFFLILSVFASGYVTILSIAMYIAIFCIVIMNINKQVQNTPEFLDDGIQDSAGSPKRKSFINLKRIVISYLIAITIILVISASFLVEKQWVGQMLLEFVEVGFVFLRFV